MIHFLTSLLINSPVSYTQKLIHQCFLLLSVKYIVPPHPSFRHTHSRMGLGEWERGCWKTAEWWPQGNSWAWETQSQHATNRAQFGEGGLWSRLHRELWSFCTKVWRRCFSALQKCQWEVHRGWHPSTNALAQEKLGTRQQKHFTFLNLNGKHELINYTYGELELWGGKVIEPVISVEEKPRSNYKVMGGLHSIVIVYSDTNPGNNSKVLTGWLKVVCNCEFLLQCNGVSDVSTAPGPKFDNPSGLNGDIGHNCEADLIQKKKKDWGIQWMIINLCILDQTCLQSVLSFWVSVAMDLVNPSTALTQIISIACHLVLSSVFYQLQLLPEWPFPNTKLLGSPFSDFNTSVTFQSKNLKPKIYNIHLNYIWKRLFNCLFFLLPVLYPIYTYTYFTTL